MFFVNKCDSYYDCHFTCGLDGNFMSQKSNMAARFYENRRKKHGIMPPRPVDRLLAHEPFEKVSDVRKRKKGITQ